MRRYVERGGISSKVQYKQLQNKVWEEFMELNDNCEIITGDDLQQIAMLKAMELGLKNFQVSLLLYQFLAFQCL